MTVFMTLKCNIERIFRSLLQGFQSRLDRFQQGILYTPRKHSGVSSFQGGIMERAMLWFKCAAMHDPVRPVLKRAAVVGWEAKLRDVELTIERPFRGDELLQRMKGWVTADVHQTIDILGRYGRLKVLDDYDLVVETADMEAMDALSRELSQTFGEEVWLEVIPKSRLA